MFRQGKLAVHGLAILLGRNETGISNVENFFGITLYMAAFVSMDELQQHLQKLSFSDITQPRYRCFADDYRPPRHSLKIPQ